MKRMILIFMLMLLSTNFFAHTEKAAADIISHLNKPDALLLSTKQFSGTATLDKGIKHGGVVLHPSAANTKPENSSTNEYVSAKAIIEKGGVVHTARRNVLHNKTFLAQHRLVEKNYAKDSVKVPP